MNPFFAPSTLPLQAPHFDRISDGDYEPAIEEGMARHLEEIARIAGQPDAPTFENTLVALERSGALLARVTNVFFAMTGANTNDALQAVETRVAPKLAAHEDAIVMNAALWARIEAVHAQRDRLAPPDRHLVERYRRDFVRAGAELSDADKERLRALNTEESSLSTEFTQKLLAATKAAALVLDRREDLAGLSDAEVDAASEAARARKLEGRWVLPLQNTTQQPAQGSLADRAVRERLFRASTGRTEHGDAHDTRAIVRRLVALRAEKAKLLGYPTWAAYALETQMAATPDQAVALLARMVPAALAKARGEAARMQALADAGAGARAGGALALAPWDWQYYAEQVRRADYALDDAEIKPYFEIDRVLRDGVFHAAHALYGLSFHERRDLPVWNPDVRVFEVHGEDGRLAGLFYADYFQRENKNGGAWMSVLVDPSGLLDECPVVFNVCNFTKPAPGQPALLGIDEVRTMFHEFGHALHALLSDVKYPKLSGTKVPRDFVEFPSQFNERWAHEPSVFARYARHHATGAPMPPELVARIERARTFDQGFALTEYLGAAMLDMAWHGEPLAQGKDAAGGEAPAHDVGEFEARALRASHVDFPLVPPRYKTSYFAHVFGGGYSAGYYAYLWAEVLAHDAFRWFEEHGGMTRDNGRRFRDAVLSRGHTEDMAALYRHFRGAEPRVEPLLEFRGLGPGADAPR